MSSLTNLNREFWYPLAMGAAITLLGLAPDAFGQAPPSQQCPPGQQCEGDSCRLSTQGWHAPSRIQWPARAQQSAASQQPLQPAVVQTICRVGTTIKRGTGTIIAVLRSTPRVGAVLTSVHTLQAGGDISIRYAGRVYPAQIVDQDGTLDIALLTFEAPVDCYIMRLADVDPQRGALMVWEGFTPAGPVRRQGTVLGYEGSILCVIGNSIDGMSGGPVFSPLKGLVSVLTADVRSPLDPRHIQGPALSWIKQFLRRGRYAWALEGCADPATTTPQVPSSAADPEEPNGEPARLPLEPVVHSATDLQDLRALIQQNSEAIAALVAAAAVPGEPGAQGEPGEPGEPATINLDDLTAKVLERLPPMRFQAMTPDGKIFGSVVERRLGNEKPLYLKSARAE